MITMPLYNAGPCTFRKPSTISLGDRTGFEGANTTSARQIRLGT